MNLEQRVSDIADKYRAQGYMVVVRPEPEDLPDFAKDFKVEIVAKRDGGGVLASAKKNQLDLAADSEIPRYAELTNKQPNWRYDIVLLGSESPPMLEKKEAQEPSEEDIRRALGDVERMLQAGFASRHSLRRGLCWKRQCEGGFRQSAKRLAGDRLRGRCSTNSTRPVCSRTVSFAISKGSSMREQRHRPRLHGSGRRE